MTEVGWDKLNLVVSVSRTTFRQFKGGQRPEDCAVCPAGYFCPHSATVHPRVCGTGSYSVSTVFKVHIYFVGWYIHLLWTSQNVTCYCYLLYAPQFAILHSQDEGSEECFPCLPGHYCSDETTSEEAMLRVMVCPPGFLCSKGLDRDPQRSAVLCPIGFYCPGGGVVSDHPSAMQKHK